MVKKRDVGAMIQRDARAARKASYLRDKNCYFSCVLSFAAQRRSKVRENYRGNAFPVNVFVRGSGWRFLFRYSFYFVIW